MWDFAIIALFLLGVAAIVVPYILLTRLSRICQNFEEQIKRFEGLEKRLSEKSGVALTAALPAVPLATLVVQEAPPLGQEPSVLQPQSVLPPLVEIAVPEVIVACPPPPALPQAESSREPTQMEQIFVAAWNWFIVDGKWRKPDESWEYAVATHWLLRIGILIALAGIGFFLKYSIEMGLLGPRARVAITIVAGLALIVLGLRLLFKRYHLLGHGLVGAGFVVLYFAFYAASALYGLIPQLIAMIVVIGITICAGMLAVRHNLVGIALLGLVGGYLTPLMLGDSKSDTSFFYIYMLLLGVGVLVVSTVRRWPVLNTLAMVAAYILAFHRCSGLSDMRLLFAGVIFVSVVHLFSLLSVMLLFLRKRLATGAVEWASLCLNAFIYWAWMCHLFQPIYGRVETGMVALALAVIYVGLAFAFAHWSALDRAAVSLCTAFAAIFLGMAPIFMFDSQWLTFAWCLQAVAMFWIHQRIGQTFLRGGALALLILATVQCALMDINSFYRLSEACFDSSLGFLHATFQRLIIFGIVPLSYAAIWRLAPRAPHARKILGVAIFTLWLYVTGETEIVAQYLMPTFQQGAVTLVWALFAFVLLFRGIRRQSRRLRIGGLMLFGVAVFKLLLLDLEGLQALHRIVAFIITGVLLVLGSFIYIAFRRQLEEASNHEVDH